MKIVHKNTGLNFNFKLIDWPDYVDEKEMARQAEIELNELSDETATKIHKWLWYQIFDFGGDWREIHKIQAVGYHMYVTHWSNEFRTSNDYKCDCELSAKATWKMKYPNIYWIMNKLMIFNK